MELETLIRLLEEKQLSSYKPSIIENEAVCHTCEDAIKSQSYRQKGELN